MFWTPTDTVTLFVSVVYIKNILLRFLNISSRDNNSGKLCLLQTAPISEIIKIGETLTILVYIKDNENQYDIRVRDCWAYDGENYESKDTHKLQLTDNEGCPK